MMYNAQSIGQTLMNVFRPDQAQGLRAGEMQEGGGGIPAA